MFVSSLGFSTDILTDNFLFGTITKLDGKIHFISVGVIELAQAKTSVNNICSTQLSSG